MDSGGGCVTFESGREKGSQVVAWRNAHNVHSPIEVFQWRHLYCQQLRVSGSIQKYTEAVAILSGKNLKRVVV